MRLDIFNVYYLQLNLTEIENTIWNLFVRMFSRSWDTSVEWQSKWGIRRKYVFIFNFEIVPELYQICKYTVWGPVLGTF